MIKASLFLSSIVLAVLFVWAGRVLMSIALLSFGIAQAFIFFRKRTDKEKAVLNLMGFKWTINDFCRGWLITGMTGSGKTTAAINTMLWQISKNCPRWGGLCIDEKGLFWETLSTMFRRIGRTEDLILIQVRPDHAPTHWEPKHKFNFLDIPGITYSSHAKTICDVAASMGQQGGNPFFKTQAHIQIEWGLKAIDEAGIPVTLKNCYEFLTNDYLMQKTLEELKGRGTPLAKEIVNHFHCNFLSQPPEQLGGVRQTLFNYLKYFTDPAIAEVFCPESSTFKLDSIDRGKVICLSIPQKYQIERRYLNTLLKICFYRHAIRRFDRPLEIRENDNLIILWADEAQKIVTATEDGTSDYNTIDVIREAKATIVAATQSFVSLVPPLNSESKTKVLISNLGNRITFKAADEESAKMAADTIGKQMFKKHSFSFSKGSKSRSYTKEERYCMEPHVFRRLKKFEAVIQHCESGWKRGILKPLSADGNRPNWY